MPRTRRLSAIMFTDIAGYTSLMQKSEQLALQTRERHRQVFEAAMAKYQGRIIQYYGDGTLSIFDSTVSAVRCAVEMQRHYLQEPALPVRIGIHAGDIILTDTDIIGDSVNVASRIESLGVPGCVLLSGKVAEEINNQDDLPLQPLGSFHFKNDGRKRNVYAVAIPDLVIPRRKDLHGKLEKPTPGRWMRAHWKALAVLAAFLLAIGGWRYFQYIASPAIEELAVLPLFNRTNDAGQMQLIDGVHDALISELQQSGMNVKARTSMMRYRDTKKTVGEIAKELGVNALLEGSVFRIDDTLGVDIRLIDGNTENLLWNKSFEANFRNVTSLYHDVIRSIAQEIHMGLSPQVEKRLKESRPVDPEAYKAYLKGQQYWYTLTRPGLDQALQFFEQSRKIDPEYALAYAGIAAVWGGRLQQGFVPYSEATPFIQESMGKAIMLGGDFPEVYFWQGVFATWWKWGEWEKAGSSYSKCLQLNPNYAEAHAYYAHYLLIMNRSPEEAIRHMETALELDPFNSLFQALYGMCLNFTGRHEQVIGLLTNTLQTAPADPVALSTLRTSYHLAGRYEEAIEIWKAFFSVRKDTSAIHTLEKGYAEGGYAMALQRLAEMLIERSRNQYVTPWQITTLYARAGEKEQALKWLEKAYDSHDANMPYISIDPIFDYLRDAPRFRRLLERMNLPEKEIKD